MTEAAFACDRNKAWTPERIDELKRLRRAGTPYRQIAKRLGVSRRAAIAEGMRLGLRPLARVRPVAPSRREEPAVLGLWRDVPEPAFCRWIAGDPLRAWRMCGHSCVHGSSWCAHHYGRVHGKARSEGCARAEVA